MTTSTTESAPTTAADLFRHSLQLLLDNNIGAWVDLWAEGGLMTFPFAPDGWPRRLEGRQAIADYMRSYPDHIDLREIPELVIHETADPETAIVEMRALGTLVETGDPYDMSYIAVITVRDGHFAIYRDYWNPLALQQPGADFTNGD
ncbi:nuclear transport factor 2 family protein [Mycobacterium sp. NPDC003449]